VLFVVVDFTSGPSSIFAGFCEIFFFLRYQFLHSLTIRISNEIKDITEKRIAITVLNFISCFKEAFFEISED